MLTPQYLEKLRNFLKPKKQDKPQEQPAPQPTAKAQRKRKEA